MSKTTYTSTSTTGSAAFALGDYYGAAEWVQYRTGDSDRYVRWAHDDFGSMYWLFRGAKQANRERYRGLFAQLDDIVLGSVVWNLNILRHLDCFQYAKGEFD